jgi:hypothetical protein
MDQSPPGVGGMFYCFTAILNTQKLGVALFFALTSFLCSDYSDFKQLSFSRWSEFRKPKFCISSRILLQHLRKIRDEREGYSLFLVAESYLAKLAL